MTRRDRIMILTVLSVVLLGGFWMLILSPQRKAAAEAEGNLATAKQSLAAAEAKLTAGRAAQQAFRRDRTTIVKLGRVVPETDDVPTLLTQLEALARKENVTFSDYRIEASAATPSTASAATTAPIAGTAGPTEEKESSTDATAPLYPPGSVEIAGGLGRTPIKVTILGTYFELERYLRSVQRFAVLSAKQSQTKGRLLIVDAFVYAPQERTKIKTPSPDLKAELTASVYFAPPLVTPGAGSAAATPGAPSAAPAAATTTSTGTAAVGGLR